MRVTSTSNLLDQCDDQERAEDMCAALANVGVSAQREFHMCTACHTPQKGARFRCATCKERYCPAHAKDPVPGHEHQLVALKQPHRLMQAGDDPSVQVHTARLAAKFNFKEFINKNRGLRFAAGHGYMNWYTRHVEGAGEGSNHDSYLGWTYLLRNLNGIVLSSENEVAVGELAAITEPSYNCQGLLSARAGYGSEAPSAVQGKFLLYALSPLPAAPGRSLRRTGVTTTFVRLSDVIICPVRLEAVPAAPSTLTGDSVPTVQVCHAYCIQ